MIEKCKILIKKRHTDINTIDGIRVNTKYGWWLLRASNTQPALIVRCEEESNKNIMHLIDELKMLLNDLGIENNL